MTKLIQTLWESTILVTGYMLLVWAITEIIKIISSVLGIAANINYGDVFIATTLTIIVVVKIIANYTGGDHG